MKTAIEQIIHFSPALMLVAASVCFFTRGPADGTFIAAVGILAHLLLKGETK